ncbi:hypothetical protein PT274_01565 [Leuconostocaceae bacterium ESL0958]|nr:hypothetical protein [Leuconostocaceae bacterium ESL0958]
MIIENSMLLYPEKLEQEERAQELGSLISGGEKELGNLYAKREELQEQLNEPDLYLVKSEINDVKRELDDIDLAISELEEDLSDYEREYE